jgi:hypothetical protein
MQFKARCDAVISKNGASYVLLRFAPEPSHFIGEIAKELGELEQGKTYIVTLIEESSAP